MIALPLQTVLEFIPSCAQPPAAKNKKRMPHRRRNIYKKDVTCSPHVSTFVSLPLSFPTGGAASFAVFAKGAGFLFLFPSLTFR
jgi:hypothetical protein